jgi:hypothetical protein
MSGGKLLQMAGIFLVTRQRTETPPVCPRVLGKLHSCIKKGLTSFNCKGILTAMATT